MARLLEHQESEKPKYYRHFRRNRTAFYTDARGVVVDEATAKTNLVLTENLELSARRQRIMQEAALRSVDFQPDPRSALRTGAAPRLGEMKKKKTGFRGGSPDVGKATRFKPGQSGNPGGRPKALVSDAVRDWLKVVDPKTGKSNAELVAQAQGKKALKGDTSAYNAVADRSEGRPAQTQQHEVISHSPVKVEIEAPDLISTLRQIYGLRSPDSQQPATPLSVSATLDRGSVAAEDRNQGS